MSGAEVTLMVFWQTRREVARTLGTVRRFRRALTRHMGRHDAAYAFDGVNRIVRGMRRWSAPTDLARVPAGDCRDLKVLATAFDEVCPRARKTSAALWHIVDAAASGYWSHDDSDTETYRRTRKGWSIVRDRRGEVDDD